MYKVERYKNELFERNKKHFSPDWSTTYARQPEILQYLKNVAAKYDLYLNAKFHHRIKSSTWDEGIKKWRMVVHDTQQNRIEEVLYDIV
jgi:cation diffusion facilitator CzcD-associated flavoprotein CzcO